MKLHDILKEKSISMPELSRLTDINYHTIQKHCKLKRQLSVENAKKIGKVLDIPWYMFFED